MSVKHLPQEREIIRQAFKLKLNEHSIWLEQSEESQQEIISAIERGCHNLTIDICDENGYEKRFSSKMFLITYSTITSKILHNLAVEQLVRNIIDKTHDPIKLASMTSEELDPSINREIRDHLEKRKQQKIKKNVSTLYECSKCKHNLTTIKTTQTRALDEGLTSKVRCENCGHTWTL